MLQHLEDLIERRPVAFSVWASLGVNLLHYAAIVLCGIEFRWV